MKKILATLAVSGLSVAAFAQGYINWTGAGGLVIGQTNGAAYSSFEPSTGGSVLTGTVGSTLGNNAANNTALGYSGYYYELLTSASAVAAPTTVNGFSSWSDTGLGSTNSSAAGKTIQANSSTLAQVNNWPANATQGVILVGWSANLGSSWATVLSELQSWATVGLAFGNNTANAAYFGVSAFGSGVQAVASTGTANQVIGAGAGEIYNPAASPMNLNELAVIVPEPATMALAAIGGASLLLFRRKK